MKRVILEKGNAPQGYLTGVTYEVADETAEWLVSEHGFREQKTEEQSVGFMSGRPGAPAATSGPAQGETEMDVKRRERGFGEETTTRRTTADLTEENARDVIAEVSRMDDPARLREPRKAESRKTVIEAIDARLDALKK